MISALVAAAFLMGLAGAPHCAAMCGAACQALGAPRSRSAQQWVDARPVIALHAGRVASYALVGALVAGGVAGLGSLAAAAPVVRPLWAMLHVGAIVLGGWLAWHARMPAWFAATPARLALADGSHAVRVFRRMPPSARSAAAGMLWGAMPCGLLQAALLVAALASSAAGGALVMGAFAIATTTGLLLAQGLWHRLHSEAPAQRAAVWSVRAAGVLLAGSSAFALWQGLGAAICAAVL